MKNHLFIGIGGQGGKSIAELRKVFNQRKEDAEALADQGIHWDFLYIDSSRDVTNNRANWTHFGRSFKLDPDSFLYLKDDGQELNVQELSMRPDISPWIGNTATLGNFLAGNQGIQGANQMRRLGRILLANNADRIRTAICDHKIAPLTVHGNQCAIHIFASLAGGTGSGAIVDLVTMLRTQYPQASVDDGFPIFLYLYVTSDEFEDAQVGSFHQNQYAAIRDLNALATGKFKPTLLGSSRGGEQFQGAEPITQIVLSTSLNDRNQRISLEKQHKIVAESAFERVFAYCNGNFDERLQKPLTGEDRLPNFPGEPRRNLLRVFRFGSTGMRRWEVPTEEVHDLLANELYVSSYNRLLYRNWSDSMGALGERLSPSASGQSALVQQLTGAIEQVLVEKTELAQLSQSLSDDFDRAHTGIKQTGFKDHDLVSYEQHLRKRYETVLGGDGTEALFSGFASNRVGRVDAILGVFQEIIKTAWTKNENPIGLAYVPDALLEAQEIVRSRISDDRDATTGDQHLRQRMQARRDEWEKLTFLSRPVKQARLAAAHKRDLVNLLNSDLRCRAVEEDQQLLDQLTGRIGTLSGAYRQAVERLESWAKHSLSRRDQILQDLEGLHEDDVSNKCELSNATLQAYLQIQRLEETHLRNTAGDLLNQAILGILGERPIEALGRIVDEQEAQYWERADETIYARAESLHNTIIERDGLEPVLTADLMELLRRRHREDPEGFRTELKEFIDSATCSARLSRDQLQPKVIRGDENMPSMPRKALVVGLPRGHAFAGELERMIPPLMPAGDNTARGVYHHDDPTQIRLLYVASWMAARFAQVVHELQPLYKRAISNNTDGDAAYFTNLDKDGQEDKRPPLLLPTVDESRSSMRAALWLGTKIEPSDASSALIQVGDGGVSLVFVTDEGPRPERIGSSLDELREETDVRTIYKVTEAVTGAVSTLGAERKEELRTAIKEEDRRRQDDDGTASTAYASWTRDRDKMHEILNQ